MRVIATWLTMRARSTIVRASSRVGQPWAMSVNPVIRRERVMASPGCDDLTTPMGTVIQLRGSASWGSMPRRRAAVEWLNQARAPA